MTEFPVDNDPNSPAKPTSVQTESLSRRDWQSRFVIVDEAAAGNR